MSEPKIPNDIEDRILERIYSSVLKFLIQLTPEETYATVVEEAIRLVNGFDGAIVLMQNGEFKKVYSSSESIAAVKTRKNGFSYRSFVKKKAFVINYDELRVAHPEREFEKVRASIFIPLSYKNKGLGTLIVRSPEDGPVFDKKELDVLQLFGSMASLAITKAEFYGQIQQALELRDKFISMAAHELRTPLTAIHGYSQLLAKKLSAEETNEGRWAQQLTYECTRMRILIDDLLEINRIRTGKTSYIWKECDLNLVLQRVQNNFAFMYPERSLIIEQRNKTYNPFIIGDFDKLLQAIINLVDNSAKFSSPSDKIFITLDKKENYYRIAVKDKGLGIKSLDINQVTLSYFIGSNHNKEGMGLGLYLVADIISAHRGLLHIKSKEGKGTTVEILLPVHNYA